MKTIIEPFKIKVVESIRRTNRPERERLLKKAGYNLFRLKAEDVLIDMLTDSGTSAMSAEQWAGIMRGDESYAGARSFFRFEKTVQEIFGLPHVIPTHQGRAAEKILFSLIGGRGKVFLSNTFFDTTRANIEFSGAKAIDLLTPEGKIPSLVHPFKGNIDLEKLETSLKKPPRQGVPLCLMTITNNTSGGQPVSLANIRAAAKLCRRHGVPFFIDACRFAENAYFVKLREKGQGGRSIPAIVREIFSDADGILMSGKKDGLVNIGGFLALKDKELTARARSLLVLTEGFPTYGGLAGRDLEAMAIGLKEVMEEDYLEYRLRSVAYLGEKIARVGVPIVQPPGGHAIYIDAKAFLPKIRPEKFPGLSLANELYLTGGLRGVEIGSVMFGKNAAMELVRLAMPRRVYTQSHIDYVIEIILEVWKKRQSLRGYRFKNETPILRHFTSTFIPTA